MFYTKMSAYQHGGNCTLLRGS